MSAQFRSGGGGLMQKSGYEAAQLPLGGGGPAGGGGGGAGGPWHVAPLKPTTGCSSMPFGATPVWPWIWSKKRDRRDRRRAAQSLERARRRTACGDKGASGLPHLRPRLRRGTGRAGRGRELGDHRLAAAPRIGDHEVDVAVVLELHLDERRPHAVRRLLDAVDPPQAQIRRSRFATQRANRCRPRLKTEPTPRRIGERLHGPALDPATDLPRLRSRRFRRREPGPRERNDREAEENGR